MLRKIIINSLYRILYQLLSTILPIITIPIISKSLGASGIGLYRYLYSIVSYFVLVAGLGLSVYGSKTIAVVRNNRDKLSITFWEIELGSAFISIIVYFVYLLFGFVTHQDNYFFILSFCIIGSLFDINWLFSGVEDFKQITLVGLFVRILSFISIVLFIKNESDLFIYFIIQIFSTFFSYLLQWPFLKRYVDFKMVKFHAILKRVKESAKFFAAIFATNLSSSIATTLLGILTVTSLVGVYANTISILNICCNLMIAIDWVLLPRMSNIAHNDSRLEVSKLLTKTLHVQLYLTIPLMFGISSISSTLVPWFFGEDFSLITKLLPTVAPLIMIQSLNSGILNQYIIPIGNMRIYNLSILLGAVSSIILNLVSIPFLGIWGAVFSYLVSESFVTLFRIRFLYTSSSFRFDLKMISRFLFSGILMYISIKLISSGLPKNLITTLFQVIFGAIVYFVSSTVVFKCNYLLILFKGKGYISNKKI